MTKENGFPAETTEAAAKVEAKETERAKEPAASTSEPTVEKNTPWFVAVCELNQATRELIIGETLQSGFQLQVEADKWIRENAKENVVYISLRRGKMLRAKVVRKLEEI